MLLLIATIFTYGIAFIVLMIVMNARGEGYGANVVEWLIQKLYKLQPFSSISPRGRIDENGELYLEY